MTIDTYKKMREEMKYMKVMCAIMVKIHSVLYQCCVHLFVFSSSNFLMKNSTKENKAFCTSFTHCFVDKNIGCMINQ